MDTKMNKKQIVDVIKDVNNLKKIILLLETKINKKLTQNETNEFIQFLKNLNIVNIYLKNNGDLTKFNNDVVTKYHSYVTNNNDFDVQEYLKDYITNNQSADMTKYDLSYLTKNSSPAVVNEKTNQSLQHPWPQSNMNLQNGDLQLKQIQFNNQALDLTNVIDLTKVVNRDSLIRESNLLIDTRYQNLANTDRSKFVFSILNDTKNKTEGSGIITSTSTISDIVEIEIFPFSIPYLSDADNYYNKITLTIMELRSSCIDAYENSQFHFLFTCVKNKNLLDLTPVNNIFKFAVPIKSINDLTIRFGAPLSTVTFDKDRLSTLSIDYNSNPAHIEFSDEHNLLSGDIIYFTDFTTLSPADDLDIINSINSTRGHICSRISNKIISINIDMNLVKYPDTNLSCNIYFGSKRILLPLKIKYLSSK